MIKVRISGAKQETDVFFDAISELVQSNKLKCNLVDKEYPNYDGTIRRYFDFDLSSVPTGIEHVKDAVTLGLRISGSETEVESMLKVLKQMGVLFGKETKDGKLYSKKRKGEISVMVQFTDKVTVAKKKLLEGDTNNALVML